MPRYIEFVTPTSTLMSEFTGGNPYHDGILPSRRLDIDAVRVDGEILDFIDPTTPNRLHRVLHETERLAERAVAIDCLAFVALMSGENLSILPSHSGLEFPDVEHNTYDDEDGPSADSLYLMRHDGDEMKYVHALYPAHLATRENYLHKLNLGPVVMSDFDAALSLYKSRCADRMPVLKYGTKTY